MRGRKERERGGRKMMTVRKEKVRREKGQKEKKGGSDDLRKRDEIDGELER